MISGLTQCRMVRALVAFLFVLASVAAAPRRTIAGTIDGTVKNGTTGKVSIDTDVILIQLQGGMQPVAKTKTDAQGHYHFDNPQLGTGPMLIRVVYRGVNYHEPIMPGKTTADVEVFEPTTEANAFTVANHAVILQTSGNELMVGEEYMIVNKTQPPVAFYREDGSFNFNLPDGAEFGQASAWGAANMPVVQGTIDKGKDKMAIAFPFRPGESGVRLAYKMPYPGNHLTLQNVSPYAIGKLIIAAPPAMQISGPGISAAGQDQGFNVYTVDNVAANAPVQISVSGTAPMPAGNAAGDASGGPGADNSQNPSVNSRAGDSGGGVEGPTVTATAIPARLDSLKWVLTGGFAAIFVLGFTYLWMKPQTAALQPTAASTVESFVTPLRSAALGQPAVTVAQLNREVTGSMDELKDRMLRLELRHQAGTIGEEDYARERARLEQTIRELVQG